MRPPKAMYAPANQMRMQMLNAQRWHTSSNLRSDAEKPAGSSWPGRVNQSLLRPGSRRRKRQRAQIAMRLGRFAHSATRTYYRKIFDNNLPTPCRYRLES